MNAAMRLIGALMAGIGAVVAVYFIINPFLDESFDVLQVWYVLDILMVIGLAIALIFNYMQKREVDGGDSGGAVTRRYLEVNAAFFLTAAVSILFLHNWFSLLADGADSLDGNHQAWIIWAAVDVIVPLILGITGCRIIACGNSES